jgi:hypothetical protein
MMIQSDSPKELLEMLKIIELPNQDEWLKVIKK